MEIQSDYKIKFHAIEELKDLKHFRSVGSYHGGY